jgi:pimeloyl-ACP methyl ester carboxylesterase
MRKMAIIEPEHGRIVEINGHRTHLLEDGPPNSANVLLLQGCGSLAQEVIAPFRNIGLRIIAPDRPGYGFTHPLQENERGPLGQSRWLERLIAGMELQPVIIAAHSKLHRHPR